VGLAEIELEPQTASGDVAEPRPATDAWRWAAGTVLVGTVVLLVAVLWRTGGVFVYVLDDPAIHLAVARRLAFDGTWGVAAGDFQSASSSPLWTLILAPTQWVARGTAGEVVPLVLNVAAALWTVRLLAADLSVLRPSRRRPLDIAAVVAVVVTLLYLPGIVFVGMEHALHTALVLATVLAVEHRWVHPAGHPVPAVRRWAPFLLAGLAMLTRGETAGVVLGLGAGLVVVGMAGWADPARPAAAWADRRAAIVRLCLAAAGAVGSVALLNLAFGQHALPNSVVLKTLTSRGGETDRSIAAAFDRLLSDPWLTVIVILAAGVVVGARRGVARPALFPAVVALVAVTAHAVAASVSADLRYQAYLYGLGTLVLLRTVSSVPLRSLPARWRPHAPAALVLVVATAGVLSVRLTLTVPEDAELFANDRYQAARFLAEAYPDDAIAISELGYVSLYHDGPITDVYGLGDHEVLQARLDGRADTRFWDDLQRRRGFEVLVQYPFAIDGDEPTTWFHVADWHRADAYYRTISFWATVPEAVEPLLQALREYEPELPDDTTVAYNELVVFAALARMNEAG
jgi:hypothetical protein